MQRYEINSCRANKISTLLFTMSGIAVKARMIRILTSTAVSDLSTLLSMPMPLRVKTNGLLREPPQLEVAICDFKLLIGSLSTCFVVAICDFIPFNLVAYFLFEEQQLLVNDSIFFSF